MDGNPKEVWVSHAVQYYERRLVYLTKQEAENAVSEIEMEFIRNLMNKDKQDASTHRRKTNWTSEPELP